MSNRFLREAAYELKLIFEIGSHVLHGETTKTIVETA